MDGSETRKKYQHTIELLASAQKDDKTIITNRLTGNFPGSPIHLEFVFTLDGDKIVSVETPLMRENLELNGRRAVDNPLRTVDVMRVRDGKITEHWGVANLSSLMQRLAWPAAI